MGANLSGGSPRRIVEQEEALAKALKTHAELHAGLKGVWHVGLWSHRSCAPPCQGEELKPCKCIPVCGERMQDNTKWEKDGLYT